MSQNSDSSSHSDSGSEASGSVPQNTVLPPPSRLQPTDLVDFDTYLKRMGNPLPVPPLPTQHEIPTAHEPQETTSGPSESSAAHNDRLSLTRSEPNTRSTRGKYRKTPIAYRKPNDPSSMRMGINLSDVARALENIFSRFAISALLKDDDDDKKRPEERKDPEGWRTKVSSGRVKESYQFRIASWEDYNNWVNEHGDDVPQEAMDADDSRMRRNPPIACRETKNPSSVIMRKSLKELVDHLSLKSEHSIRRRLNEASKEGPDVWCQEVVGRNSEQSYQFKIVSPQAYHQWLEETGEDQDEVLVSRD